MSRGLAAALAPVVALLVALAPAAARAELARLELRRAGGEQQAVVRNISGGTIEVELSAAAWTGMDGEPALPLRRVLAPGEQATLLRFWPVAEGARHELLLAAIPGPPFAEARDVVYSLPVEESAFELGQGFHGPWSHDDDANRYAVDLVVPEGTPVLAARGGVVMEAVSGFHEGGLDPRLAERSNRIRIQHDDGSMAVYGHLAPGGVFVRPGERVTLGQVIGRAGRTGYASGPHLHFAVQVNGGMRLVSVPFRMIGPAGFLPLGR